MLKVIYNFIPKCNCNLNNFTNISILQMCETCDYSANGEVRNTHPTILE